MLNAVRWAVSLATAAIAGGALTFSVALLAWFFWLISAHLAAHHAGPSLFVLSRVFGAAVGLVYVACLFSNCLRSSKSVLRKELGFTVDWVEPRRDDPSALAAASIAVFMGCRGPKVRVVDGDRAFALKARDGQYIVIGLAYAQGVPPAVRDWVVAHEIAHIANGDTNCLFWSRPNLDLIQFAQSALAAGANLGRRTRGLGLLLWPVRIYFWLVLGLLILCLDAFVLIDRFISRRLELRADRWARRHAGVEGGVAALNLFGDRPVRFWAAPFRTHPTRSDRLRNISLGMGSR